ncbi:OsmC family protein [Inquilinus sp. KBS0705]|nr:OsmC family protein [Inquilinus sp. KBS0705]
MEDHKDSIASASGKIGRDQYHTVITSGKHTVNADEPEDKGGTDKAMNPFELLLASLGSCTVITLRMYINRKMWAIDAINVNLELFKTATGVFIETKLHFTGEITDEQRKRLITIADACPVHKLLIGNVVIDTSLS